MSVLPVDSEVPDGTVGKRVETCARGSGGRVGEDISVKDPHYSFRVVSDGQRGRRRGRTRDTLEDPGRPPTRGVRRPNVRRILPERNGKHRTFPGTNLRFAGPTSSVPRDSPSLSSSLQPIPGGEGGGRIPFRRRTLPVGPDVSRPLLRPRPSVWR